MCKINCNGGCIDCAPEEWWDGWWSAYFRAYFDSHYKDQGFRR